MKKNEINTGERSTNFNSRDNFSQVRKLNLIPVRSVKKKTIASNNNSAIYVHRPNELLNKRGKDNIEVENSTSNANLIEKRKFSTPVIRNRNIINIQGI